MDKTHGRDPFVSVLGCGLFLITEGELSVVDATRFVFVCHTVYWYVMGWKLFQ